MQTPTNPARRKVMQRFHSQRSNEIVVLETRRHWWAWVRWMPISVMMAIAGIMAAALLPVLGGLFVVIGLVFAIAFTLYLYADWINDSIVVTDQRIVRITRNLLRFSEQVSEIPLSSIQEINADIPNWDLFAIMFRYGFIAMRTSGQAGDIKLSMIPNPGMVQDIVLTDYRQRQQDAHTNAQDEIRRNLERMVSPDQAYGFGPLPKVGNGLPPPAPWSPWVQSYPGPDGSLIYRHHWIVWLRRIWIPILVLVAAFISLIVLQAASLGVIGLAITFILAVVGGVWFWWVDQDFRNDYMIVNNNTITMLHQRPLWLQNERDVLLLKRVDNIIAESQGFFNQMLNKGTLRFSLIGGDEYKQFANISNPLAAQAELTRRQGIARRADADKSSEQQQALIGQYLNAYNQMLDQQGQQHTTTYSPVAYTPPTSPVSPYPPAQMPNNPRPNLTEGRPYAPQLPIQPPPYQQPVSPNPSLPNPYQPPAGYPPAPQQPAPPPPAYYPPQGSYPSPEADPHRATRDFPPPPGVKPRQRS